MSEIGYSADGLGDTVDKHSKRIELGDQVHIVYGGAGHHMAVDRISVHPETRLVQIHGTINVSVPATTATRLVGGSLVGPHQTQDDAEDSATTSTTPKSKNSPKKEK